MGARGLGFRGLGFRVWALGVRGLGFRGGFGLWGLGFGISLRGSRSLRAILLRP